MKFSFFGSTLGFSTFSTFSSLLNSSICCFSVEITSDTSFFFFFFLSFFSFNSVGSLTCSADFFCFFLSFSSFFFSAAVFLSGLIFVFKEDKSILPSMLIVCPSFPTIVSLSSSFIAGAEFPLLTTWSTLDSFATFSFADFFSCLTTGFVFFVFSS